MTGRGANREKAAIIKRLNPEIISESLELTLETEGIPVAVALITNKKIFCIKQLLAWKTWWGKENVARHFFRYRLND